MSVSRKDSILALRQTLVNRRNVLRAVTKELDVVTKSRVERNSGDSVDVAQGMVEDDIAFQLAEVEGNELEQIEYALEQMQKGKYGVCEGCGTNIPMPRLNALPHTTLCILCQQKAEREEQHA